MKFQVAIIIFRLISVCFMSFALSTIHTSGQVKFEIPVNDTLIDFSSPGSWLSEHGPGDRVIESNDKVLYVKYLFSKSENTLAEFFRITDMEYYYIDYYQNGQFKSKGTYKATDTITHMDIVSTNYPYPPYDVYDFALCFRSLYKSGEWLEYSAYSQKLPYLDYWNGKYCDGKKCGIWIHETAVMASYELERIDYSTDSNKTIYLSNRISEPLDTVKELFIGNWRDLSCNESDSSRIELRKCQYIKGTKKLQCYDGLSTPNHYVFSKNGNLEIHSTKNCVITGRQTDASSWKLVQDGTSKYLELMSSDKVWKYRILYIDNRGSVLLERSKI